MSDNKTAQAGVRLSKSTMKAFRLALSLKDTTAQQVLEQAIRVFIVSAGVTMKE